MLCRVNTRCGSVQTKKWVSRLHHSTFIQQQTRSFASVYAVGEGWTGAFGTGRFDEHIPGHDDESIEELGNALPIKIFDGNVDSISVGWGHTAIVSTATTPTATTTDQGTTVATTPEHDIAAPNMNEHITTHNQQLWISGRPQDFSALLRLRRLPVSFRKYAVQQTHRTSNKLDEGADSSFHPLALVERFFTWVSDTFIPGYGDEWDSAREQSSISIFTSFEVNEGSDHKIEIPEQVICSAGFSAILTTSGKLYTMGLNGMGQCGIGVSSPNVWKPQQVTGLTSEFATSPRAEMEQTFPITEVALGLQHTICINSEGELFGWGKADRGQIGLASVEQQSPTASPIKKSFIPTAGTGKPIFSRLGRIKQVGAGMIHSAALDDNNNVFVWGKNMLSPSQVRSTRKHKEFDAKFPTPMLGLPPSLQVLRISCGSHHTAVLLEDGSVWGTGLTTDTRELIHDAICLVPGGVIELPVRQFQAHMDRTTIIGADGRQVFQVNMWQDVELRDVALFTPAWIQNLLDSDSTIRMKEIHRSWLHSVALTD